MTDMGIGTSIVLLVAGAILAFAVHYTLGGVDLQAIGYILMLAGLVGLVISMVLAGRAAASGERTPADEPGPRY